MVRKKLENGKVIIKDQYGIYSFITEGVKKVALVGCKNLMMNREDKRDFKVYVAENRPWIEYDWEEVVKDNLTRAEAKSMVRHFAKEVRDWEEKYQMLSPNYYGAKQRIHDGEIDYCINNTDTGWKIVEL